MPLLKGGLKDGLFEINNNLRLTGSVLASALNASPWATPRFVDGVSGSDTYSGATPDKARATVQSAVTSSARGDIIYIRPLAATYTHGFDRYLESVTVPLATEDLSLIGVTNSLNPEFGPKISWVTAGEYALTSNAPAMHVENLGFYNEGTEGKSILLSHDATTYLERGGDGATFYNCTIKAGMLVSEGGDGLYIRRCRFHAMYDGTYSGGIYAVSDAGHNPRRLFILDNIFQGGNGTAGAQAYITVTAFTEVLIAANYFAECAVDAIIGSGCSGLIADNHFWGADEGACITLGSMIASNNHYDTN
jgi:hypothetical protein